jgi:hypothetical protein
MNQVTIFGRGNFPRSFTMGGQTYPTWQMGAQGAELSPMARQLGVRVLPAGATSRQELRYLLEEAKRSGSAYVEAPEVYTRGGRELDRYGRQKDPTGLYNQQGKRFSGTFLGSGSSSGVGMDERKGPSPSPAGGPQPEKSTNIPTRSMGTTGSPLAFTRFGGRTGALPMPTSTMNPLLNLSVPRFPFGGY